MKITDVRTVLLTGPSSNEEFFGAVRKSRSASFIEIETDGDLTGIGETYLGYFVPEAVPELVEFFKPILVGLTDKEINPRKVWERMYRCANYWARSGAGAIVMAGIEGALWDLRGKMDGVPVYELLGGCLHERLLCYATGGPCPYPWTELKRRIDGFRGAGFRAFKVATGYFDPVAQTRFESTSVQACVDLESEKLEVIRAHAGKDFVVCLDGHMSNPSGEGQTSWDVGIAKVVLSALEPYDLFFFEEPLHYNNVSGYAELRRNAATPVAGTDSWGGRDTHIRHLLDPLEQTFASEFPDYKPSPFGNQKREIKRLVCQILMAEALLPEFANLFRDMSETAIDEMMQSFLFKNCIIRKPLAQTLADYAH